MFPSWVNMMNNTVLTRGIVREKLVFSTGRHHTVELWDAHIVQLRLLSQLWFHLILKRWVEQHE